MQLRLKDRCCDSLKAYLTGLECKVTKILVMFSMPQVTVSVLHLIVNVEDLVFLFWPHRIDALHLLWASLSCLS